MKKIIKIFFIFLLLNICLSVFCASKINIPSSAEKGWVNDYANVLDPETQNYIFNCSKTLQQNTTADLVVVTIETLGGEDIFNYATEIMRGWKIGTVENKNSLLILLSIKEREINVAVGTGLEGKITDAKSKRYIEDYAAGHLKENKYSEGIKNLYSAFCREIYNEYNMRVPEEIEKNVNLSESENSDLNSLIIILILLLFSPVAGIFYWINKKYFGKGPKSSFFDDDGFGFGGFGSFGNSGFSGSSGENFGGFGGGGGYSGGGASGKF